LAVSNYLGNIRGKNRKVSKDPKIRLEVACRVFDGWGIIDEKEKKEKKRKEAEGKNYDVYNSCPSLIGKGNLLVIKGDCWHISIFP
jgi:hypothetical protein